MCSSSTPAPRVSSTARLTCVSTPEPVGVSSIFVPPSSSTLPSHASSPPPPSGANHSPGKRPVARVPAVQPPRPRAEVVLDRRRPLRAPGPGLLHRPPRRHWREPGRRAALAVRRRQHQPGVDRARRAVRGDYCVKKHRTERTRALIATGATRLHRLCCVYTRFA